MRSNGCCVIAPKPSNVDEEYGSDCISGKLTNDNEP